MNIKEYLINLLAEESVEVAHIALKANRFGLDDFHPQHKEPLTDS